MEKDEKELIFQQIERAKAAVIDKKCFIYAASQHSVMEFMNLDIDSSDEIWPLITDLLNELIPLHRVKTNFKALENLSPESYVTQTKLRRLHGASGVSGVKQV